MDVDVLYDGKLTVVEPVWAERQKGELRLRALQMAIDARAYEEKDLVTVTRAKAFEAYLLGV